MTDADQEWRNLSFEASRVFTPAAPIDGEKLFAGRISQLRQVIDAVNQKGQHAIIFGERGVGKTSLANVISAKFTGENIIAPRINCDTIDTYSTLWKKVFEQIKLVREVQKIGFGEKTEKEVFAVTDQFEGDVSPDNVRHVLSILSANLLLILIIDEFDRISSQEVQAAMADTIKTLSDNAISATIVLVGVADSVDELISEHHSIERALVQIQMPRMSIDELYEIIENGLTILKLAINDDAKKEIALLSRGLPHYTHLLSLYSVREALDKKTKTISLTHVQAAISKALEQAQQTTRSAYHKATTSSRKDNIYSHVLLACALARTDELGYFAAGDIRIPLNAIMDKTYDIPSFSRHLYDFCEDPRGPILQKSGIPHRYKFRFINPLMQPYIIMQGLSTGLVDAGKLDKIKGKY